MAASVSTGFPVVIDAINEQAYLEKYAAGLLPHLVKEVGVGEKGNLIQWPYFDPTTIATAASVGAEANDFSTTTALTNASKTIAASEFVVRVDVTDTTKEGGTFDFIAETSRQIGLSLAKVLDSHIYNYMVTGFATGTVTGTNSTNGFQFHHYAAARTILDAKALTVPRPLNAVVPANSWYWTAKSTFSETYGSAMGDLGNEVLNKYRVKRILGDIDIYTLPTNIISAATNAGAVGVLFCKESVGLWTPRKARVEEERNASARATEYVGSERAGSRVLIPNYGARLRMYAGTPS